MLTHLVTGRREKCQQYLCLLYTSVFSFFQTKTTSFLNGLNYLKFSCTSALQYYVERDVYKRQIVTNRDRHGREMCLVAIVAGTKSETVIAALRHIDRKSVV